MIASSLGIFRWLLSSLSAPSVRSCSPLHSLIRRFDSSYWILIVSSNSWAPGILHLKSHDECFQRINSESTCSPLLDCERRLMCSEQNGMLNTSIVLMDAGEGDTIRRSGETFSGQQGLDMEDGKAEKRQDDVLNCYSPVKIQNQALLSGLAYCISSCSMILVNKLVLSGYDFYAGISLMLYQNFVSVTVVSSLSLLSIISTEPLTWDLVKVWLPVNVIFVGMLITSMFRCVTSLQTSNLPVFLLEAIVVNHCLKHINVAMVTILKNVSNVITAVGETYVFMKHHDKKVWAALGLMIISAISAGATDLSFHAVGYAWQLANCFLTASYSLTLRRVMDTAKPITKSGKLSEFSMVLLNNTLSLPLGFLLMFASGEVEYLYQTPLLKMPMFWLVITLSGVLGLAISFTSMWFLHQTSATTYSLVGSLNKIPLSIAGIFLFKVPTSMENFFSILFGLLAGITFAKAKLRENSQSSAEKESSSIEMR